MLKIGKLYTCDKRNETSLWTSYPNFRGRGPDISPLEWFVVLGVEEEEEPSIISWYTITLLTTGGLLLLAKGCALDWFKEVKL